MDTSFSWETLAASAVGGLVGNGTNQYINMGSNLAGQVIGGTVSGFAGSAVASLLRGESLEKPIRSAFNGCIW